MNLKDRYIDRIRGFDLLEQLSPSSLESLIARSGSFIQCAPGDLIYAQGQEDSFISYLLEGRVERSANGVIDLSGRKRDEVLREMVSILAENDSIPDMKAFYRAILERERLVSTGIGFGIAIPHAKIPGIRDFSIALGRSAEGVDYPSLDDTPVQIVVMIGGPDGEQIAYLKLLASVQRFLKNERDAILEATNPESIRELIDRY